MYWNNFCIAKKYKQAFYFHQKPFTNMSLRLTESRIKTIDLKGVTNRHGLSIEQYRALLIKQRGKCALSGIVFKYDPSKKKVIDPVTNKAPCIDHCHTTGMIRGILSSKLNLLCDQWVNGVYGKLTEPSEIREYRENYPARFLDQMYK